MSQCPTCGRAVPTIFEHIDADCADWPDRSEDGHHDEPYPDEDVSAFEFRMREAGRP